MTAPPEKQRVFTNTLLEYNSSNYIKGELSCQTQRNVLTHPALVSRERKKNTVALTVKLSKVRWRLFASADMVIAAEKHRAANALKGTAGPSAALRSGRDDKDRVASRREVSSEWVAQVSVLRPGFFLANGACA
jgi:hypothetical protein